LEYDAQRYNRVIEACALSDDIRLLPNGDSTSVGERGVSLSGGQKARVNLARALYVDADIYLLDDPLSAVDAHVGRDLFDKAIKSFLNGKIRVLVTHQLHYLNNVDQILILNQVIATLIKYSVKKIYHNKTIISKGQLEDFGTFNQLCRTNATFRMLKSGNGIANRIDPDDVVTPPRNIKGKRANKESSATYGSIEV
jgi:ABC-type transport system involved in cytochrome bd biosynthesis fused ATPase/permease subunit